MIVPLDNLMWDVNRLSSWRRHGSSSQRVVWKLGHLPEELPEYVKWKGVVLQCGSKIFDDPQPGSKISHHARTRARASNFDRIVAPLGNHIR